MGDQKPEPVALIKTPRFAAMDHGVFMNHAAVSVLSPGAAAAMRTYVEQAATRSYVGGDWYKRIEAIREMAAELIGANGGQEIAFIPNTSTGINLVARGLPFTERDEVVITGVEYPANRYPWTDLHKRRGVKVVEVAEGRDGRIDAEDVVEAITDRTKVVAISHVQYASGFRINLKAIAAVAHQAGAYLCVDGIQSVGALPVDAGEMGIDFLAADGHKWLMGPEGAGIFYCREELAEMLHPAVIGWLNFRDPHRYEIYDQTLRRDARRFEAGTLNVPGLLGLGASIEMLLEVGMANVWARIEWLTDRLVAGLRERGFKVFSPRRWREEKSGIVTFEPREGKEPNGGAAERVATRLSDVGIIVAARAGRVRVSPHFYNTGEQVDRVLAALGAGGVAE